MLSSGGQTIPIACTRQVIYTILSRHHFSTCIKPVAAFRGALSIQGTCITVLISVVAYIHTSGDAISIQRKEMLEDACRKERSPSA